MTKTCLLSAKCSILFQIKETEPCCYKAMHRCGHFSPFSLTVTGRIIYNNHFVRIGQLAQRQRIYYDLERYTLIQIDIWILLTYNSVFLVISYSTRSKKTSNKCIYNNFMELRYINETITDKNQECGGIYRKKFHYRYTVFKLRYYSNLNMYIFNS